MEVKLLEHPSSFLSILVLTLANLGKLVTQAGVGNAFFHLDVKAEVGVGFTILDLLGAKDSGLECMHCIFGVTHTSHLGAHAHAIGGLSSSSSVEVDTHGVSVVLEDTFLSLSSKSREGGAHVVESLLSTELSGKELAHGASGSVAAREPPELELVGRDLSVTVEVDLGDHAADLTGVKSSAKRICDLLELSSVDESTLVLVELLEHLVDVGLHFVDASLHVFSGSGVLSSSEDLGVFEIGRGLDSSDKCDDGHCLEPDESIFEESEVISFFDEDTSCLEPVGYLGSANVSSFGTEA